MKDFQPSVQLPDENGNYHLYLAYLNGVLTDINGNSLFIVQDPFQQILNKDGIIMQKLKRVPLYGELFKVSSKGKIINTSFNPFSINKDNICCKITDLYFDYRLGEKMESPGMVGLMGVVKPFGPKSYLFKNDLYDENEFVALDFRGLADQYIGKNCVKVITVTSLFTFDYKPLN